MRCFEMPLSGLMELVNEGEFLYLFFEKILHILDKNSCKEYNKISNV